MINIGNLWSVEWSAEQKSFHVDNADALFARNMETFALNKKSDWLLLGFFPTNKSAHDFVDKITNLKCKASEDVNEKWDAIWKGQFS